MSALEYVDGLRLDAPDRHDAEAVRQWRNSDEVRPSLRTAFMLTREQQADFYENVCCNRYSRHRYFAVRRVPTSPVSMNEPDSGLFAFGGLTNIEWENGNAEISLIVNPALRGMKVGSRAVTLLLAEAFERMRLAIVFGEVYHCNGGARIFWEREVSQRDGAWVTVPDRKFWNGKLYASTLFWFDSSGMITLNV